MEMSALRTHRSGSTLDIELLEVLHQARLSVKVGSRTGHDLEEISYHSTASAWLTLVSPILLWCPSSRPQGDDAAHPCRSRSMGRKTDSPSSTILESRIGAVRHLAQE